MIIMIKKLNEGRVRDVITLRDLFSLTRANIRVTIVDTSIDEFVVEDDYIYNVVKDSSTILDFPVDHFSPRSSTSLWIEVSVGIGNIGDKLSAYKESKSNTRRTPSNRHLRRMYESPVYSVTDGSYYDEIAKEVAQYMGYSENEAYDELQSDPQSIIDYLEDEEDYYNNRSLIKKIEKYFM
jgi:hypothetical protein